MTSSTGFIVKIPSTLGRSGGIFLWRERGVRTIRILFVLWYYKYMKKDEKNKKIILDLKYKVKTKNLNLRNSDVYLKGLK